MIGKRLAKHGEGRPFAIGGPPAQDELEETADGQAVRIIRER